MTEQTTSDAIGQIIRRMEHRLQIVREVQHLADEDPALLDELRAALALAPNGNGEGATPRSQTVTDRLFAFFRERGNRWVTAPEIIRATGIGRGTLAPVLHSHTSDLFEKRDHPESKKLKQWRLRQEVPHAQEG
jgi:hypothetical protein